MRRVKVLLKNIINIPLRFFSKVSVLAILQESTVDKNAAICSKVRFYRSKIGRYSYVGNNSFVADTIIGNFTSISTDCYIGGTSHPIDWVSTSPVFHKWENIMKKNFAYHDYDIFRETIIGSDVWIGNRVMIRAGCEIGDGAVVGMGSVVTKDIPPYEIWAGNPARLIKKRFDNYVINEMLEFKWWTLADDEILKIAEIFDSPDKFREIIK